MYSSMDKGKRGISVEMATRNLHQLPLEGRKGRTLYAYEIAYTGKKKDSRTISALDAKLVAMQNLIYGISKTKRRSEERRVGKECGLRCRSRWSPYH
jgi:hypothetical protein